jgi:hypothetical protein
MRSSRDDTREANRNQCLLLGVLIWLSTRRGAYALVP